MYTRRETEEYERASERAGEKGRRVQKEKKNEIRA